MNHYRWRCTDSHCKKSLSLRQGTFFENTRIALQQILMLVYWWCRQYPVTQACQEAGVSKTTAIDMYQWLREVCSYRLSHHDTLLLGGTGPGPIQTHIIQIDESCFSHKPKVNTCSVNLNS